MNNNDKKCKFCNLDKTLFYNTIIEETKNFIVIPTIGSLVDGYVLIISKKHFYNMLELNIKLREEYYNLINKYREIFNKVYNKYPIIFEHGTSRFDKFAASSIFHAHTHIVNHSFSEEKDLINNLNFKNFNILNINCRKNTSYIMYISPTNQSFITQEFEYKSQLMRYYIAKDLQIEKSYNWKKNFFYKNIKLTINKIKTID